MRSWVVTLAAADPDPAGCSVAKMPLVGEDHGHAMGVGRRHHLVVTQRAPGLHHGGNPGVGRGVQAVPEREESVAGARPADCPTSRLLGGDPAGVPTVLLAGPDAYRTPVLDEHDGG